MAERTLAQLLAEFAAAARFETLPEEVVDSVRKRVLDVLGICVAASSLDTSAAARAYAAGQGGLPQAHAVAVPGRMPATLAAFVNGVLAHSPDYDDTHLPSVLHPSAAVVPAALAAAEAAGADGATTIAAIAAGLETCVRIGMAGYDARTGNSTFFEHGQHATSICGALGGAVAAGILQGFDPDRITHALGIAASMAAGVIEANRTGGTVKRMHCGWAAHAAVSAPSLRRTASPARRPCSRAGSASSRPGCTARSTPRRSRTGSARCGRCPASSSSRIPPTTSPMPPSTPPWRCGAGDCSRRTWQRPSWGSRPRSSGRSASLPR